MSQTSASPASSRATEAILASRPLSRYSRFDISRNETTNAAERPSGETRVGP